MDVVVTLPQRFGLTRWMDEGDLPGEPWNGDIEWDFYLPGFARPAIRPGERVYVVYKGHLIGYAPLVRLASYPATSERTGRRYTQWSLVRHNDAVAVTVPGLYIPGFRGFRYRVDRLDACPPTLFCAWSYAQEIPYPEWTHLDDSEQEALYAKG